MVTTKKNIRLQFLKKFETYPIDSILEGVTVVVVCNNLLYAVFSWSSNFRVSPLTPVIPIIGVSIVFT